MADQRHTDRLVPASATVLKNLGLLQDLAGLWEGKGFNLIARPDFHDKMTSTCNSIRPANT